MTVSLVGGVRHPKIYAYTIPEYAETEWVGGRSGRGLVKVGETQRDVLVRVREQLSNITMPTKIEPNILVVESAITGEGEIFSDRDVHKILKEAGYHNLAGEWFECTPEEVTAAITAVKQGEKLRSVHQLANFILRPEQARAVAVTAEYFRRSKSQGDERSPDFLWNAKMRFGKTFTAYELAKEMGWTKILVLSYKPAVESSWRQDLRHVDFEGWRFHGKEDGLPDIDDPSPLVWFASFQDVLGKDDEGKAKLKNRNLYEVEWDVVIVDEYHFGAWRDAARSIYVGEIDDITGEKTEGDQSEAKVGDTPDLEDGFVDGIETALSEKLEIDNYLYLSGTPFRALTEGEFLEDQVFNWTYSDEQREKKQWKGEDNPYASLPQMHLLAYEMPDKLKEVALNSLSEFSLTEFFRTKKMDGEARFIHENEVQKWLDLLRGQDLPELWTAISTANRPPMPYADVNLLTALQHTVWYLPGVDACFAMEELLTRRHNRFFRDYEIIIAAGNAAGMGQLALGPVADAITPVPQETKTITLTCGKLLTGVTVPAWTGILMLRELKSPETYFQAAFRVQSPWAYELVDLDRGGKQQIVVKDQCYVIDFSPNRALRLIVEYATKLRTSSLAEFEEERALQDFIEFLPILAFDGSTMSTVNAGDVIDYLTKGISASMLARRWNSPELIVLDVQAMEAILADKELLESLEQIELFRNISDDLTAMISTNQELKPKKLAKEKLSKEEKVKDDEAKNKRQSIRENLRRFLTRIPVFMYLTDLREKTVVDIIRIDETDLFEQVTTLSLKDFERLFAARVFNESKMNDAVWKFRKFEEPSLSYTHGPEVQVRGGWNLRRDERFAELIERGILSPGQVLTDMDPVNPRVAHVSDDFGVIVDGVRHEGPNLAAAAVTGLDSVDGWEFWRIERNGEPSVTLESLRHETPV